MSASKAGSRSRSSASASRSAVVRRPLRAGETVPTWLARMPRRPEWNAPPSDSRTSLSPYQLSSMTVPSGREQVQRPLEPGGRRAGVHDQVATVGGVGRQREVDAERGRDVGPAGIDVDERDLHAGNRREQARDAAADHPGADDGDPVAEQRRGVPQGVDGGLDGAGEHGTRGRHALGHDDHRAGRHHVGGLVRVQAEDRAAAQLRRSLLHDADVEVAVLDRPGEVPLLERRPHRGVLAGGTPPRNTSVSVPRLTPDRRVRTRTSSRPGSGSVTGRISPQPGRAQPECVRMPCAASPCQRLRLLRNESELADPSFPQPVAPEPVGGQQLLQCPGPDLRGDVRASAANASINESATARWDRLQSSCQRTTSPTRSRQVSISCSGVSQTVSASGMLSRSASVRGRPSSMVKANRPPVVSARDIS